MQRLDKRLEIRRECFEGIANLDDEGGVEHILRGRTLVQITCERRREHPAQLSDEGDHRHTGERGFRAERRHVEIGRRDRGQCIRQGRIRHPCLGLRMRQRRLEGKSIAASRASSPNTARMAGSDEERAGQGAVEGREAHAPIMAHLPNPWEGQHNSPPASSRRRGN